MSESSDALLSNGDGKEHAASLLPKVYEELRAIAHHRLKTSSPGASIQPTELLHEAYVRLAKSGDGQFETRRHFVAAAAMAMRSVLVDRARAKGAAKRGGGGEHSRVWFEDLEVLSERPDEEILAIDAKLIELEKEDSRSSQVVILRFYLGLSESEIAQALGITERTVRRDWVFAKAWLQRALSNP